jgi:hypothetical protein
LAADGHDDVCKSRRRKSLRAARFNFVRAGREKDDSIFVAVTVTFGTAAAFGSVTRPSMFPVFACDCAKIVTARDKKSAISRGILDMIFFL